MEKKSEGPTALGLADGHLLHRDQALVETVCRQCLNGDCLAREVPPPRSPASCARATLARLREPRGRTGRVAALAFLKSHVCFPLWHDAFRSGAAGAFARGRKTPPVIGMLPAEKPGTIFGRVPLCSLYNHYLFTTASNREL